MPRNGAGVQEIAPELHRAADQRIKSPVRQVARMSDYEVDMRLGYSPCVCGVIDGTWHPECYKGKTKEQIAAGYKRAYAAARRHLKKRFSAATLRRGGL